MTLKVPQHSGIDYERISKAVSDARNLDRATPAVQNEMKHSREWFERILRDIIDTAPRDKQFALREALETFEASRQAIA